MSAVKTYDKLNRLAQIRNSAVGINQLPFQFSYEYNDANQRVRATLADGSFWQYGYDWLGQVTSGKRYFNDGTPVPGQQFEYGFDDIGNRRTAKFGGDNTGASTALRSSSYAINLLNQITTRDIPGSFDVLGIADSSSTVSINSSSSGIYRKGQYYQKSISVSNGSVPVWQSVAVTTSGGGSAPTGYVFVPKNQETPTYDLDGNLTQDGRWDYTWDSENRLIKMQSRSSPPSGSNRKLEFEYDYMGRRIRKKVTDLDTSTLLRDIRFLYDGWNMIAEMKGTGTSDKVRAYLWGLDLSSSESGAGGVGGMIGEWLESESTFHFAGYDGNGNVAGLVGGATGTINAAYEYGPFGEPLRVTSSLAKTNLTIRFSSKYTDDESDLIYYGHRYYTPSMGRWINRDPIEEQGGLTLYGFVKNNAPNSFDRFGLGKVEIKNVQNWDPMTGPYLGFWGKKFDVVVKLSYHCGGDHSSATLSWEEKSTVLPSGLPPGSLIPGDWNDLYAIIHSTPGLSSPVWANWDSRGGPWCFGKNTITLTDTPGMAPGNFQLQRIDFRITARNPSDCKCKRPFVQVTAVAEFDQYNNKRTFTTGSGI